MKIVPRADGVNRFDDGDSFGLTYSVMRRVGIVAGFVLVAAAVGLFFLYSQTEVERQLRRGEWVWLLVVGVDEGARGDRQANFVAAAGVSPDGGGAIITIPGEIGIPQGNGVLVRLEEMWETGGVGEIRASVEGLLELTLDHWVVLDFELFRHVVDAAGGVEVEVEERLVYVDLEQDLFIDIPAGTQQLDGERALQYVRYRGYAGDPADEADVLGRQIRAQTFLTVLWEEVRSLPWGTWREMAQHVAGSASTDLSAWEMLDLARAVRDVRLEKGQVVTAPVSVVDGEVLPDFVRVRQLVQRVYRGHHYLTRDQVRVAVFNGAGVRLLAHRSAVWLSERGFEVSGTDNADRSDYEQSYLLSLPGAEDKARMVGEVLPRDVRVEKSSGEAWGVDRLGELPEDTDVVLVLGRGFDVGR